MRERDSYYMELALKLASRAGAAGEVPIGALVVSAQGDVLGEGYNQVERYYSQRCHAELIAIEQAGQRLHDWRLMGCALYVTLEPCMMCISAAALSRIERVVYGASSPVYGYRLDKEGVLQLYTNQIKNITGQVEAEKAAVLLRDFFSKKRI